MWLLRITLEKKDTPYQRKEVPVKCEIQVFITFIGVLWTGISSFETGRNSIEEE